MLGRRTECRQLTAALAAGRSVLVSGEPGIGKTQLVREALAGRPTRWGVGLAGWRGRPYAALTRAMRQPAPDGPAPVVAEWVQRHLGDDGVLVVDDAQFADPATLALLPGLLRRVTAVVIVRDGEPGSAAAVHTLAGDGVCHIDLGPLPRADAVELMVRSGAPAPRAHELADLVRGNPLWCRELAKERPSRFLEVSLAAQVARLDPPARTAVVALGLLGRPCDAEVLGRGVSGAVDAGLCEIRDGSVRLCRPLVGRVAVARADDTTRATGLALLAALPNPIHLLLSVRETEILRLVGQGLPTRLIATRLDIRPSTVDSHVRSAVAKLGAENRRHAAARLR